MNVIQHLISIIFNLSKPDDCSVNIKSCGRHFFEIALWVYKNWVASAGVWLIKCRHNSLAWKLCHYTWHWEARGMALLWHNVTGGYVFVLW